MPSMAPHTSAWRSIEVSPTYFSSMTRQARQNGSKSTSFTFTVPGASLWSTPSIRSISGRDEYPNHVPKLKEAPIATSAMRTIKKGLSRFILYSSIAEKIYGGKRSHLISYAYGQGFFSSCYLG